MEELSRMQRDLLVITSGFKSTSTDALKEELEDYYYSSLTRQHLLNNLNSLVEDGYLIKGNSSRANTYQITDSGRQTISEHRDWIEKLDDGH